jgi:hypothetical protein
MLQTRPLTIHLPLAAALLGMPALAADPAIRAELQNPAAVRFNPRSTEPAVFNLTFDVRVTNLSKDPVTIPEPDKGPDGAHWFELYSVQSQQAAGNWSSVSDNGNHMLKGSTQFVPCRLLSPGETVEIKNVSSGIILYSIQRGRLGAKSVVRLVVALVCRQQDGELHTESMTTDPFVLSMPAQP